MRWCESEFHLISLFFSPLRHLFTSIYASRPDWNLPRCIGHVCVGFTDPTFERGVCALKPPGREVIRKFEREREGWQTLWCAEIDNIKGITWKKTHTLFLATVHVTSWYNHLDEYEADGCRSQNGFGIRTPHLLMEEWRIQFREPNLVQNNSFFFFLRKTRCMVFILTEVKVNTYCGRDGNSSIRCVTWLALMQKICFREVTSFSGFRQCVL